MKSGLIVLFSIALCWPGTQSFAAQSSLRFEDYKVKLYKGRIHRPRWIRHVADDEWRDELDKLVEAPNVNFAGKYFVAVHGCGTYCRYYTITDLSSGRESNLLREFGTGKEMPDGFAYLADLMIRQNSRMLVAQWRFDSSRAESRDECRERVYIFNGSKLRAITGIRRTCTRY